jgi:hypothetical protein
MPGPADCQGGGTDALDGLEAFRLRRRSVFYPKADLPKTAGLARLAQAPDVGEEAARQGYVAAACRHALGCEPAGVEPLGEQGTFHRLYRVALPGGAVVVKVNSLSHPGRDFPLLLDTWAAERLRAAGLPALRVFCVDLSRRVCPFDYQIIEQARGVPLKAIDHDEASLRPRLFQLGRTLARLHRIPVSGFGLMDVGPLADGGPAEDCRGMLENWPRYVRLNLEEHLRACTDIGAIDGEMARQAGAAFERHAGLLEGVMRPGLLHGDPGSHNVFTDRGAISALIDWEDCLAGDPLYEIAFWATFHPDHRHPVFLDGYGSEWPLPDDFGPRFWLYYLRVALCKTVLRHRLGIADRPGRPPASERIRKALAGLGLTRLAA